MTFESICHGFALSLVEATTAAAVSSHDVSMPRIFMPRPGLTSLRRGPLHPAWLGRSRGPDAPLRSLRISLLHGRTERVDVRRTDDAVLGDDAGDVAVRGDVEGRIPDLGTGRRQLRRTEMRDLLR